MEARSRVAATAAAVVPFHCVICFDEFTLNDRPPMVLPCGHTYVCLPCSKRLKRCMECREPLFVRPPAPRTTQSYSSTRRYGSPQQPPSTPVAPVPLPIPKNVVLLALMEAAQRQLPAVSECLATESLSKKEDGAEDENESTTQQQQQQNEKDFDTDDEEEDQFDLNRIISGMATLSGPCGTYVVKETLAVVPLDPRKGGEEEKKVEDVAEPYALEVGQTVQVVDFDEGIAKLARHEGFIVAASSQLVKVGGPLDESCRLEGLLSTVEARGSDLQQELNENHTIEESLRQQFEDALKADPTHPVVKEAPKDDDLFLSPSKDSTDTHPDTPNSILKQHNNENASPPYLRTPEVNTSAYTNIVIETGDDTSIPVFCSHPLPGSPVSIDNADIAHSNLPRYRRSTSSEDLHQLTLGCGTGLLGETSEIFSSSIGQNFVEIQSPSENQVNQRNRTGSDSSHPTLSAPAHHYETPRLTSSFDQVDFRTGLSGHRALTSAHKWTNAMYGAPRHRHIRMMGEHRGLGRTRAVSTPRQSSPTTTASPGGSLGPLSP